MPHPMFSNWTTYLQRRPVRRPSNRPRLCFVPLEPRHLLASISFDPGTGIVSAFGSAVNDHLTVTEVAPSNISVAFDGGPSRVFTVAELAEVKFWGGAGDDYFANETSLPSFFGGHTGNDTFLGGSGNDRVMAGDGEDVVDGRAGDDYLDGGNGNDTLYGRDGNDELHGWFGDDTLYGGDGDDYLAAEFDNDTVYGEGGNDYVLGSIGDDLIWGGDGDDLLYGQGDDDMVDGGAGNDAVRGSNGNDFLYGGDGNDFMMADAGDDYAEGQGGHDYLFAYSGIDVLKGGDGNDQVFGESGTNELWGDDGDDLIMGGDGDDVIFGNAGDDTLFGLDGNDRMFGGEGVDHLVGGNGNDAIHGGSSVAADTMLGNAGQDRFLHQSGDVIYDRAAEDAVILFEDATSAWTDIEISVVERGLNVLYLATESNALLLDALTGDDLRLLKYDQLGGYAGVNYLSSSTRWYFENGQQIFEYEYSREIHIADWDESSSWMNDEFMSVTIHEIAHNFDSRLELEAIAGELANAWDSFTATSGWTDTNPNSNDYTRSSDGQWWYLNTATFAEEYGRTNPFEDFCTVWEYYFENDPADYDSALLPKTGVLTGMFEFLTNQS